MHRAYLSNIFLQLVEARNKISDWNPNCFMLRSQASPFKNLTVSPTNYLKHKINQRQNYHSLSLSESLIFHRLVYDYPNQPFNSCLDDG